MFGIFVKIFSDTNRWLDALSDGVAGLQTISSCMTACDLKNDDYYKLVAAEVPNVLDAKPKLKVLRKFLVKKDIRLKTCFIQF